MPGRMSAKARAKQERDEWNTHVVDEAVAEAKGYQYDGHWINGQRLTVTFDQLADDVRNRWASGDPILPIKHFDSSRYAKGFDFLLTDNDMAAVEAGYFCENCLEAQEFPGLPKCSFKGKPERGCGFRKRLI